MKTINNKIDKSRLFKRAWFLVKSKYYSLSFALITVWKELKEAIKDRIETLNIVLNPSQISGSTWAPNADTMQSYYNSNAYKGD